MVNDLQALASAEAAAEHLNVTRCDLAVLTDGAIDAMTVTATVAHVEVHRNLQPALVDGDPTRLRQVVTNLLSNAVKFSAAGGRVTVTVSSHDTSVTLVVADTGSGIDADELPRTFDRYWRGRTAAGSPGTGIGLAIAADLVAAHRGTITAESAPQKGTRFVVTFPAALTKL